MVLSFLRPSPGGRPLDIRAITTLRNERLRALAMGILDSGTNTFALLIAVSWFHAPGYAKSLIAAAVSFGFLLAPLIVSVTQSLSIAPTQGAGLLLAISAGGWALAGVVHGLTAYLVGATIGIAGMTATAPLILQMYNENYPRDVRGRLFSQSNVLRVGMSVTITAALGRLLAWDLELFPFLLTTLAGAAAIAALLMSKTPSTPGPRPEHRNVFRGLVYLRDDVVFRNTIISWMLLGTANLIMNPLRIEYLANPDHGAALPIDQVALYVGVIPNLVRLLLTPIWGYLFDRLSFFAIRFAVNTSFLMGILCFFTSNSTTGLMLGSIAYGIGNGGGDVVWNLWVTKLAVPTRAGDYMAIHTFMTGVRGLYSPLIAFWAIDHISLPSLGLICGAMIVAANAVLVKEMRRKSIVPATEARP